MNRAEMACRARPCAACGAPNAQFRCACKQEDYCCQECQKIAWEAHKSRCVIDLERKAAQKASAGETDGLAEEYYRIGNLAASFALFELALKHFKLCICACAREPSGLPNFVSSAYVYMGMVYQTTCRFDMALKAIQQGLRVARNAYGEDNIATVPALDALVKWKTRMGDARGSLDTAARCVAIVDATFGRLSAPAAASLLTYSSALDDIGESDEALKIAEECVRILQSLRGRNSSENLLCKALRSAGAIHAKQGRIETASSFYRKALKICRSSRGDRHPDVIEIFRHLAQVAFLEENRDEALRLARKSLKLSVKMYGRVHMQSAWCMQVVATILQDLGDYPKAMELYEEALEVTRVFPVELHELVPALQDRLEEIRALVE